MRVIRIFLFFCVVLEHHKWKPRATSEGFTIFHTAPHKVTAARMIDATPLLPHSVCTLFFRFSHQALLLDSADGLDLRGLAVGAPVLPVLVVSAVLVTLHTYCCPR